jgi:tetratricopeptide (TPR) repeat protein
VTLSAPHKEVPSVRGLLVGVAAMVCVAIAVQIVRDRQWTPFRPAASLMWLNAGPVARRLALGYDNLLADIYWIRTVVYYGGVRREAVEGARNYDLLRPMLDMVTTLDPDFKVAYRFGAIFLTEAYPNGPGRPEQAIDLLQRAIAQHPNGWEYVYDIGFVHYWWLGDYQGAASWFRKAAAIPGAAEWLEPLAATTLVEGGDRNLSRQMWRQMQEDSDIEWIRRSAELRLTQLDALDAIDRLAEVIARFKAEAGRPPQNWAELITTRLLPGVPLDPAGIPFVLDETTGTINVAEQSPLWPLPIKQMRGPQ